MNSCVPAASTQISIAVQNLRHAFKVAVLAGLVFTAGCWGGTDGPVRYPVSGGVTYDGQPVLDGEIVFTPDVGNSGPATIAIIRESKYAVPVDRGIVGGKYVVTITAFQVPKGSGPLAFRGPPMFPDYTTKVEFPKKAATQDFNVPAAGAAKK